MYLEGQRLHDELAALSYDLVERGFLQDCQHDTTFRLSLLALGDDGPHVKGEPEAGEPGVVASPGGVPAQHRPAVGVVGEEGVKAGPEDVNIISGERPFAGLVHGEEPPIPKELVPPLPVLGEPPGSGPKVELLKAQESEGRRLARNALGDESLRVQKVGLVLGREKVEGAEQLTQEAIVGKRLRDGGHDGPPGRGGRSRCGRDGRVPEEPEGFESWLGGQERWRDDRGRRDHRSGGGCCCCWSCNDRGL